MSVIERELQAEEALSVELQQYAGQWVAIKDAHVIAAGSTLGELLEQVGHRKEVELLEVPEGDCTVSFF